MSSEAMLHVADGPGGASYVQLLEPLGPDTPVGKFLAPRAARAYTTSATA